MTDAAPGGLPPIPAARGRHREVWVGLFVIVGLVLGLLLLFTMTDPALFRGRYIVITTVPDAGGIRRGDPVQMRGVNIGRILFFRIGQQGVEVGLEIEGEYPVPADSKVHLKSAGLLGGMVADIEPGRSPQTLSAGDRIPGSTAAALMPAAERIVDSGEKVLTRVEQALSEQTVAEVKNTVASLERGSAEAEALLKELRSLTSEQRERVRTITDSLRRAAEGVEGAATRPELTRAIERLDAISSQLERTTSSLDRSTGSLEKVLERVERGEGTLGRLSKDDALYLHMDEASQNLSKLLDDLRRNPKRYVKLSLF
jgi:phospholipid/cholesterol/gamma-HCH transport system substrate-binding protein